MLTAHLISIVDVAINSTLSDLVYRELDLKTFNILKCGLVSRAVLDSDMNTEVCRKKKVLLNLHNCILL